jgi:hypothetical protein
VVGAGLANDFAAAGMECRVQRQGAMAVILKAAVFPKVEVAISLLPRKLRTGTCQAGLGNKIAVRLGANSTPLH